MSLGRRGAWGAFSYSIGKKRRTSVKQNVVDIDDGGPNTPPAENMDAYHKMFHRKVAPN
jgi:hypothetical protein